MLTRTLAYLGCIAFLAGCSDEPAAPRTDAPVSWRPRLLFDLTILPTSGVAVLSDLGANNMVGISPNGVYATGTWAHFSGNVGILALSATGAFDVLPIPATYSSPAPEDVNDYGMVAGSVDLRGVFWPSATATPIVLPPLAGDPYSAAYSLTNETNPTVVGTSTTAGGLPRAVKWVLTGPTFSTPTVVELSSPGTLYSSANSVNAAANTIVGHAVSSPGGLMAVRWHLGTGAIEELGIAGYAWDVNSSGVVVGNTNVSPAGFIKDGATVTMKPGAPIYAINDDGIVVGTKTNQGFAWSGMSDDPLVGFWTAGTYVSSNFNDISNNAKVVGTSHAPDPFNPGYLITNAWVLGFNVVPDDGDRDAISASSDNCPNRANADQADVDTDGIGNVCDPDFPPIFTLASANRASAPEGTAVKFSASAFDPGGRAVFYSWSFPDGAVVPKAVVTRAVGNPGTFAATAGANNHAGGVQASGVNVTVTNQLPALTFAIRTQAGEAPAVGRSGVATTIDVRADDSGPSETLAVVVTWVKNKTTSHNCSSPCSFPLEYTYLAPGEYTIAVKVTDANGGVRRMSLPYEVLHRTIALDIWPGSASTIIDLDDPAQAEIRVAVLGSPTFDARRLETNVKLTDGAGTAVPQLSVEPLADVNGDGRNDRVFRFSRTALVSAGNLALNASALVLTGRLGSGAYVKGVAAISVVN